MIDIEIKDIITIGIAGVGWAFGIIQFIAKRKWQKRDILREQRFNAYKQYMKKMDEIGSSIRREPISEIGGALNEFLPTVLNGDSNSIDAALLAFNTKMYDSVKRSLEPLTIVSQELNELRLLASDKLVSKIDELKVLAIDLSNEMQNCLNQVSCKDGNSFSALSTVGYDKRWSRFAALNEEIFSLMRKELSIN